jgi:hypothetical protein
VLGSRKTHRILSSRALGLHTHRSKKFSRNELKGSIALFYVRSIGAGNRNLMLLWRGDALGSFRGLCFHDVRNFRRRARLMAAPERIANEAAGVAVSSGTICRCSVRRPQALEDLYRASCPEVTFKEFASDLNDATMPYWYAFKDEEGEIRVAMFVWNNGAVWIVARPGERESPEVKRGFLVARLRGSSGACEHRRTELLASPYIEPSSLRRDSRARGFSQ